MAESASTAGGLIEDLHGGYLSLNALCEYELGNAVSPANHHRLCTQINEQHAHLSTVI
jgi:hypothetical protein